MQSWLPEEHERDLARFVVRERRKRVAGQLNSPRGRIMLQRRLAHFSDLDMRWCEQVPPAQPDAERSWLL